MHSPSVLGCGSLVHTPAHNPFTSHIVVHSLWVRSAAAALVLGFSEYHTLLLHSFYTALEATFQSVKNFLSTLSPVLTTKTIYK